MSVIEHLRHRRELRSRAIVKWFRWAPSFRCNLIKDGRAVAIRTFASGPPALSKERQRNFHETNGEAHGCLGAARTRSSDATTLKIQDKEIIEEKARTMIRELRGWRRGLQGQYLRPVTRGPSVGDGSAEKPLLASPTSQPVTDDWSVVSMRRPS